MSTMAMATVSVAAPVRATAGSKAAKPAFMGRAAAGSKASLSDAFCAMSLATPARKQANRSLSICGEYSFETMDAPERVRTALSGPPSARCFFPGLQTLRPVALRERGHGRCGAGLGAMDVDRSGGIDRACARIDSPRRLRPSPPLFTPHHPSQLAARRPVAPSPLDPFLIHFPSL